MSGLVSLVGAGPGDEGLITVKGLKAIEAADVIIYDYLANPRLLRNCKATCEKIYVGKKSGNHTLSQEGINDLIVEKASAGNRVVRLKGGDPYIFGRGGEEGVFLHSKGIDFEVVPGISSSIGGLAYAGIPVTYREIATSFHVITGHTSEEANPINYPALAKLEGTLVFLMGIGNMEKITQGLILEGKSPQTPAAIVYEASTPRQKVEVGTLENLVSKKHVGEEKPGIIVIGDVIKKREILDFFSRKPLFGKKIIITRATQQNSTIVERITELGGLAVELPTIQIEPIQATVLKETIRQIKSYQHIIFTSQNAVSLFIDSLKELGLDLRCLSDSQITSIGAITTKTLEAYQCIPDFVASTYSSEGVLETLKSVLKETDHVLLPRSKKGNKGIVESLEQLCHLKVLEIYDTVIVAQSRETILEALEGADWVFFTSGSTVDHFIQMIHEAEVELPKELQLLSIGPMTSERLIQLNQPLFIESPLQTMEGMLECLIEHVSAEAATVSATAAEAPAEVAERK
jgi:uroporphyrinogen III methyltransferase / synthase